MADRVSDADLKTIYRETIDSLYAFASRRCGGYRELAEDVVQEAWLRAVRTWGHTGVPELPPQISNYLDERVLRFLRSSTAGDNGSVVLR